MNYEQYQEFVLSRAKPGADIQEDLINYQTHIWHMATGLIGEVIELFLYTDKENLIEELGDIEFYLAGLLHAGGRDDFGWHPDFRFTKEKVKKLFKNSESNPEFWCMHKMLKHSGDLLDYAKKLAVYQKAFDLEKFNDSVHGVRLCLEWMYIEHGITGARVRAANKKKLMIRFPDGYSNKHARERKDKQNES